MAEARVDVTILKNARVVGLGFVVEGRKMSVPADMAKYLVTLGLVADSSPPPAPERKRRSKRSKKNLVDVASEVGGSLASDGPPSK